MLSAVQRNGGQQNDHDRRQSDRSLPVMHQPFGHPTYGRRKAREVLLIAYYAEWISCIYFRGQR